MVESWMPGRPIALAVSRMRRMVAGSQGAGRLPCLLIVSRAGPALAVARGLTDQREHTRFGFSSEQAGTMAKAPMLFTIVLALGVPTSSLPLSAAGASASVFRIEVAAVSPYYLRPWEKSSQRMQRGTGFLVEGRRLLTNFHVIEDAVDIRLSKSGNSKRWRARVAAVGPDVDLAVLEVTEDAESFFEGLQAVEWSNELPALQSRVTVRGYPTGGNSQCVTEGVVSRVDCKNYRLGHTSAAAPGDLLVVQIDAAINGGNSGGPCFDASHRVVGVAFQGIDGAQSIGYIIPASIARTFLAAAIGASATGKRLFKFDLIDGTFSCAAATLPGPIHLYGSPTQLTCTACALSNSATTTSSSSRTASLSVPPHLLLIPCSGN